MAETKQWLEREAVPWLRGTVKLRPYAPDRPIVIMRLTLQDCVLSFTDQWEEAGAQKTRATSVPMKDLDLGNLAVRPEDTLMTTFVSLETTSSAGKTVVSAEGGKPPSLGGGAALFVAGAIEGQRVVNAIRRAAVLCGATPAAF